MNKTEISWTDMTWNPVTGCTKKSPGCQNCYAEALSKRFGRAFDVEMHPERLEQVRKISPGSKVFVNSMSDLFHPAVPYVYIERVLLYVWLREKDVVFQVLTKRPARAGLYFAWEQENKIQSAPRNLWLGVSIEMKEYLHRIVALRNIAVPIRFVSFEPLLGDIGKVDLTGIDWIIIGGESGPHARPMKIQWARNLVTQAKEQGVAVWMKQLGGLHPGGNIMDFPEDLRIQEFPEVA